MKPQESWERVTSSTSRRALRAKLAALLVSVSACASSSRVSPATHSQYYQPSLRTLNQALRPGYPSGLSLSEIWPELLRIAVTRGNASNSLLTNLRHLVYEVDRYGPRYQESAGSPSERIRHFANLQERFSVGDLDQILLLLGDLLSNTAHSRGFHDQILNAMGIIIRGNYPEHTLAWWQQTVSLDIIGISAAERNTLIAQIREYCHSDREDSTIMLLHSDPNQAIAQLSNGLVSRAILQDLALFAINAADQSKCVRNARGQLFHHDQSGNFDEGGYPCRFVNANLALKLSRLVLRECHSASVPD